MSHADYSLEILGHAGIDAVRPRAGEVGSDLPVRGREFHDLPTGKLFEPLLLEIRGPVSESVPGFLAQRHESVCHR